ncbi:MAG: hypothetical protein CMJ45_05495 [Planctomyces sp.]|nr:hypothetical protein [Planctomyces sp.]
MTDDLSELLFNGLNEQGYLFQEACAQALLKNSRRTGWELPVWDYSVALPGGPNRRIDIVLSRPQQNGLEAFAIIECKRANPDYAFWMFAAPDRGMPEEFHGVILPRVGTSYLAAMPFKSYFEMGAAIPISWMEVRRDRRSNQRSSVPQTIEDAVAQVLLGTTGLAIEQFNQRTKAGMNSNQVMFFPVIVTTARLFVANYNTDDIDLESGTITREKVAFGDGSLPEEERWVLINYPEGESTALAGIPDTLHSTNPADLDRYKIRSVYVVNANHLLAFFQRLNRNIPVLAP